MTEKSPKYKREILNQVINFFWTIICFAPVLWFWIREGINLYFYLFVATSLIIGMLPEKIINLFMLSSSRRFYEQLGVKQIRRFVQNGDLVNAMTNKQKRFVVILDVNSMPNLEPSKSFLPLIARHNYISFHELINRVINQFLSYYRSEKLVLVY